MRTHTALGSSPRPAGSHFSDVEFNYNRQGGSGHSSYIADQRSLRQGCSVSGTPAPAGSTPTPIRCRTATPSPRGLTAPAIVLTRPVAHTYIKDLYFTIQDTTAPRITALGGTALAGGRPSRLRDHRGHRFRWARGLNWCEVKVNGVVVAQPRCAVSGLGWIRPAGPRAPSTLVSPTLDGPLVMNTETGPWADGENLVEVCVDDLSFDQAATQSDCETRTVLVDNSCPSSGGTQATSIEAGLQAGTGHARAQPLRIALRTEARLRRGTLGGPGSRCGLDCLPLRASRPARGRPRAGRYRKSAQRWQLRAGRRIPDHQGCFDVVYRYNNEARREERGSTSNRSWSPTFKVVGSQEAC